MRYNSGQTDELVDPNPSLSYPWLRRAPYGRHLTPLDTLHVIEEFKDVSADFTDVVETVSEEQRLAESSFVWSGSGKGSPSALAGLVEFVARLAERWDLSSQDLATLLGFESAEMVLDMLKGESVLHGRDAEERVANLFRIYEAVFGLFRDANAEREWIRRPIDYFQGKSCLQVMQGGSIEDLIDVRRAVEHIAGR